MDSYNFPTKNDAAAEAAGNMVGEVRASGVHLLDATKMAGKKIGAVAQEEASTLRADLDDFITRLSSLTEQEIAATKEKILVKIEAAKMTAKNVSADVSQKLHHGVEVTSDYVKEKPLRSVAIATGVGVLLGMWFSRDRDRRN